MCQIPGVSIDSKLSFNKHVDNLCKKANSVLSFVRRNFANCSRKIKDLYLTYVKSTLEYAATAWAPYSRQSINKLKSVQRRAARFVMHDYNQTSSVSNMLLRLNWNTMETHFKHLRLQMLHKIIHSSVGVSLPSYITHRTRHTMPGEVTLNLYSQTQLLTHTSTASFLHQSDYGTIYLLIGIPARFLNFGKMGFLYAQ